MLHYFLGQIKLNCRGFSSVQNFRVFQHLGSWVTFGFISHVCGRLVLKIFRFENTIVIQFVFFLVSAHFSLIFAEELFHHVCFYPSVDSLSPKSDCTTCNELKLIKQWGRFSS